MAPAICTRSGGQHGRRGARPNLGCWHAVAGAAGHAVVRGGGGVNAQQPELLAASLAPPPPFCSQQFPPGSCLSQLDLAHAKRPDLDWCLNVLTAASKEAAPGSSADPGRLDMASHMARAAVAQLERVKWATAKRVRDAVAEDRAKQAKAAERSKQGAGAACRLCCCRSRAGWAAAACPRVPIPAGWAVLGRRHDCAALGLKPSQPITPGCGHLLVSCRRQPEHCTHAAGRQAQRKARHSWQQACRACSRVRRGSPCCCRCRRLQRARGFPAAG